MVAKNLFATIKEILFRSDTNNSNAKNGTKKVFDGRNRIQY